MSSTASKIALFISGANLYAIIELAVGQIDEMILFSGDGDFRPMVAAVQRRGVRVAVVSTIATNRRWSPMNCAVSQTCLSI